MLYLCRDLLAAAKAGQVTAVWHSKRAARKLGSIVTLGIILRMRRVEADVAGGAGAVPAPYYHDNDTLSLVHALLEDQEHSLSLPEPKNLRSQCEMQRWYVGMVYSINYHSS